MSEYIDSTDNVDNNEKNVTSNLWNVKRNNGGAFCLRGGGHFVREAFCSRLQKRGAFSPGGAFCPGGGILSGIRFILVW